MSASKASGAHTTALRKSFHKISIVIETTTITGLRHTSTITQRMLSEGYALMLNVLLKTTSNYAGQYWKGAIDNIDLAAGLDHGQKLRDGMGG